MDLSALLGKKFTCYTEILVGTPKLAVGLSDWNLISELTTY